MGLVQSRAKLKFFCFRLFRLKKSISHTVFVLLLTTIFIITKKSQSPLENFDLNDDPNEQNISKEQITESEVTNLDEFKLRFDTIPADVNRSNIKIVSREKKRNRALISLMPKQVLDGLGHRFTLINWEILMTMLFDVGYIHRNSLYGSLTPPEDTFAIDRMYGFVLGFETKDEIIAKHCSNYTIIADACPKRFKAAICTKLKSKDEGGQFDHLIHVPPIITECYVEHKAQEHDKCHAMVREFVENHQEPNTLFQMTPSLCHTYYRSSDYEPNKDFLRFQYWNFHTKYGNSQKQDIALEDGERNVIGMFPPERSRILNLNPGRIQIAVHIRRGDFFDNPHRSMIPDAVYASVIGEIKRILDSIMGKPAPIDVRIYSEGWSVKTKDNHDVRTMKPIYLDENKAPRNKAYWINLIKKKMEISDEYLANLNLFMHIASDTIQSLHDMFASDFFIGSHSGLSMQITRVLGRGIMILPSDDGEELGNGRKYNHLKYSWRATGKTATINQTLLRQRVVDFFESFK